ncbi:hypothetical protein ES706_06256 [subsurface metagenome]
MSTTKEEAHREIGKLVAKYRRLDGKAIRRYGEANTRRNFIEPLFRALGWDISNREEVTEEESISRKRVDYAFRLRGIPKFFLEAKSLKTDLNRPEYARQAINYAYHKGTTWAVLTDFEGLKVFNAEWKEPIVSRSLFFELSYDQYLSRFDWLWLLSRQAFEQNLLDQKALELFKKTKKTPVGQQLFSDLVSWRRLLDKYLSAYNKKYPSQLIDESVQRILDRLIFIRTCEDRETEPPILRPLLREWQNGAHKNLVQELKHIWRDFDQGYDSRLFMLHLADELECDPTPFAEVIEGLYATKDRSIEYDFNAIDADVLGGIYEQYLEHLIKRAGKEIEVIPERGKRKARGIYYTPKFVVRYIVENTLRPTLEGKPLSEAREIKILDPACGSGSFLVEALDYLERHWRQQKWLPRSSLEGNVKQKDFFDYLARVQFLTQNLYGVDLDAQAVEIAQLNLLLKALNQRQRLPDLVNNIRHGNSLISGTEEELKGYFGDAWREKKPFNWEQEFKDIMADGGFDVVIGNPPYGDLLTEQEKNFLFATGFTSGGKTNDVFRFFVERGLQLLKENGLLGMILPNSYLTGIKYEGFRNCVLQNAAIVSLINFGVVRVFEQGVFNSILILRRTTDERARKSNKVTFLRPATHENHDISGFQKQIIKQSKLTSSDWIVTGLLLAKIMSSSEYASLDQFCDSKDAGINYQRIRVGWMSRAESRLRKDILYDGPRRHESDIAYLKGIDIDRYQIRGDRLYKRWLRHNYNDFIKENETVAFNKSFFEAPAKIITRQTGDSIIGTVDTQQWYTGRSLHCTIPKSNCQLALKYILGLLNSKLMTYIYQQMSLEKGRAQAQVKLNKVRKLPIRCIDFDNPTEKKMHDDLVALVDKMLELNKRVAPIRNTPCNERDELLREINYTDNEIDNLVYDLYGLTEEERKIVERD